MHILYEKVVSSILLVTGTPANMLPFAGGLSDVQAKAYLAEKTFVLPDGPAFR